MSRNTLDLDNCDKEKLERILNKLKRCPYGKVKEIWIRESAGLNGYHIVLWCECPIWYLALCRLVFDDTMRDTADWINRTIHERNVLFREKSYRKGRYQIRLKVDEWVRI